MGDQIIGASLARDGAVYRTTKKKVKTSGFGNFNWNGMFRVYFYRIWKHLEFLDGMIQL